MTGHSPERAIAHRALRSTVIGATACAVGFAVMVASTSLAYVSSFPTEASRRQLSMVTAAGGGLSVLFGPVSGIETVGGYAFYKNYAFLTSIAAVWAVLVTTRSLRGEEDSGRWQLLLSGATRPSRATAAVLGGLGVSVLIVAGGVFVGTAVAGLDGAVGFSLWDSIVHASALGLVPAVFAAVAALTSQLGRTRRVATGTAMGVLACAFVLRMIGDAGPSTRWVRWITPLGWSELISPLTRNDLRPLLPAVLVVAVLALATVTLADRRDVGSGVLRTRDSAAARFRGLGSATGLALRLETTVLVAWAVGVVALGLAFGVVSHMMLSGLPGGTKDILERFGVRGTFVEQYFGLVFLWVAAVVAMLPAGQIGAAAAEELSGRSVLVLAGPTRRSGWLTGRLVIASVAVTLASMLTGLSLWVGAATQGVHDVGLAKLLGSALAVVPVCLVALGFGAVALALAPRIASAAVYAFVGWSLVVDVVASLVDGLRWVGRLGLFHYLALAPAQPVDATTSVGSFVVAVALCVVAVVVFARRDLRSA